MSNFFLDRLRPVPVLAILRGLGPTEAIARAEACWAAGIQLVEVSLSDSGGPAALKTVASASARPPGAVVGAGTVIDRWSADQALAGGAGFFVSPGIDVDVATMARQKKVPFLPGVATATEIQTALGLGYEVVKMFPAAVLGVSWLKAMTDPFPQVSFVATGGVTADNASDFLSQGAAGVAMASSLDPERVRHLRAGPPAG